MTLKTTFLIIWLATGERHVEPVTEAECSKTIATVQALRTLEMEASTQDGTAVVRIGCGDADVVLALPPSDLPCDLEGA